jgi:hypothetical protein
MYQLQEKIQFRPTVDFHSAETYHTAIGASICANCHGNIQLGIVYAVQLANWSGGIVYDLLSAPGGALFWFSKGAGFVSSIRVNGLRYQPIVASYPFNRLVRHGAITIPEVATFTKRMERKNESTAMRRTPCDHWFAYVCDERS